MSGLGQDMENREQVTKFTDSQRERYARHFVLREIGEEGQKKLLRGRVLVIGAGGLGSPAAMYLSAAGVGHIGIADADEVDLSNLQRQLLHGTPDLGVPKVLSARETLERINPDVQVHPYQMFVTEDNIRELVRAYDFILDCTDNFQGKFLINDACVRERKPFCHAGVLQFHGQVMTYVPGQGPCYRCVFKEPPPEGAVPAGRQAGIVGAVAGVAGSIQALEAIKYLLGRGELLCGKLLTFDALTMKFRAVKLPRKVEDCPVCGGYTAAE